MSTGIVLGGGGTLGDFQVGALKYLYEKGVLPDIKCVCGTSIGAINAAIVATGEDCDEKLESYWFKDVKTRVELIPQHEWSEDLAPLLNTVIDGAVGSWVCTMGGLLQETSLQLFGDVSSAFKDFEEMAKIAKGNRSLYTADRLEKKMREEVEDLDKALTSEIAFRLYATDLKTGAYTCFYNKSCDTDRDKDNKGDKVNVLCESREKLIKAALASAAVPAIFPPVEVDGSWYIDGSAREVVPIRGAIDCGADTIFAILCFPRLTRDREDSVVDHPTQDWTTSSLFDIRTEDFSTNCMDWSTSGDRDLLDIANRAAAIVLDEITNRDLAEAQQSERPVELTVIDPFIPVHGLAELNIGLIKINMDQGFMRAFDEVGAPKTRRTRCRQLTKEITSQRVAIWRNEHALIKQWAESTEQLPLEGTRLVHMFHLTPILRLLDDRDVVDTNILRTIRQQKRDLKPFIKERLKIADSRDSFPDDYKDLYLQWERHDLSHEMKNIPLPSTPWDRLDLGHLGAAVIPEEKPP
ncbi:MAG: patatin-like phospholipase family protein [Halobacteriota archaeon]